MKLHLLPHHMYRILISIFVLNIFFLFCTWAFHFYYYNLLATRWEEGSLIKYVLLELTLASENTIATWYSSMLFFLVGLMALVCFHVQKKTASNKRETALSFGWLVFFLIFTLLSFDEIASMHERLGNLPALNPFGDYPLGWVILLALPIGLVAIFMLVFCWMQIKIAPRAAVFAVVSVLLFISIPFQEFIEMEAWKASQVAAWKRPVHFLLIEEGSEIFGATFMLLSTLLYTKYVSSPEEKFSFSNSLKLRLNMNRRKAFLWVTGGSIIGAVLVQIAEKSLRKVADSEMGVMWNWLPAAIAFMAALLCFYIYYKTQNFTNSYRSLSLLLAFLCIFLSAYYGSNMYNYFKYLEEKLVRIAFLTLLFSSTVFLGIKFFHKTRGFLHKLGFASWAVGVLFALTLHNQYSAAIAFVAFTILFLTLFSKVFSVSRPYMKATS